MRNHHTIYRAVVSAACLLCVLCTTIAVRAQSDPPSTPATTSSSPTDETPDETPEDATGAQIDPDVFGEVETELSSLRFGKLWTDNGWLNWGGLLAAIFLSLAIGRIATSLLARFAAKLAARDWTVRSHVFNDLIGPLKLALLALGLTLGQVGINGLTNTPLHVFIGRTLLLLYSLAVFWYAFNLVSVVEVVMTRITAKTASTLDEQLVPLIRKALRVFIVVLGAMFIVDNVFKQDIGAWLAGLGIAGLAVSLAAQDSLKNLFGSLTILLDQPFQLGERILFGGHDGIVEEIGFRSTKVRTLTGNVVTIPNSMIVNDPVENVARRPSIRRIMNVTITYDTPREKIEQAVQILRDILEEDDLREPIHQVINGSESPPRVYFNDFNAESLNIFVIYWYAPPAWWDYMDHAQRLNLRIFEEFEKAGIEFAFPTQTVYLAGDPRRELAVKMLGQDLGS
ncbi:MAG TPA: mechanosensitive ion channel family protein [Thermoguttaceae bacterium]|nr:mechanosensitive ion channel family protein [Thermoguttaceae bacterium]